MPRPLPCPFDGAQVLQPIHSLGSDRITTPCDDPREQHDDTGCIKFTPLRLGRPPIKDQTHQTRRSAALEGERGPARWRDYRSSRAPVSTRRTREPSVLGPSDVPLHRREKKKPETALPLPHGGLCDIGGKRASRHLGVAGCSAVCRAHLIAQLRWSCSCNLTKRSGQWPVPRTQLHGLLGLRARSLAPLTT
jgi:hypothetical protein